MQTFRLSGVVSGNAISISANKLSKSTHHGDGFGRQYFRHTERGVESDDGHGVHHSHEDAGSEDGDRKVPAMQLLFDTFAYYIFTYTHLCGSFSSSITKFK